MSHYLVCTITGKPTTEPVVSLKTGKIYEKSTLQKHIDMYGTSPFNNAPMGHEDYISIKGQTDSTEATPLDKQSVHELVAMLRDDYDSVAIESFSMKKYIEDLRRQLSHSLYQNDAAYRVISRLMKERDQARE